MKQTSHFQAFVTVTKSNDSEYQETLSKPSPRETKKPSLVHRTMRQTVGAPTAARIFNKGKLAPIKPLHLRKNQVKPRELVICGSNVPI